MDKDQFRLQQWKQRQCGACVCHMSSLIPQQQQQLQLQVWQRRGVCPCPDAIGELPPNNNITATTSALTALH